MRTWSLVPTFASGWDDFGINDVDIGQQCTCSFIISGFYIFVPAQVRGGSLDWVAGSLVSVPGFPNGRWGNLRYLTLCSTL